MALIRYHSSGHIHLIAEECNEPPNPSMIPPDVGSSSPNTTATDRHQYLLLCSASTSPLLVRRRTAPLDPQAAPLSLTSRLLIVFSYCAPRLLHSPPFLIRFPPHSIRFDSLPTSPASRCSRHSIRSPNTPTSRTPPYSHRPPERNQTRHQVWYVRGVDVGVAADRDGRLRRVS